VDPDRCPYDPEDSAERYCLRRMGADEATVFAAHCGTCASCAALLAREVEIVGLMRAAERGLRRKQPNKNPVRTRAK
jgi:hypothetical protein